MFRRPGLKQKLRLKIQMVGYPSHFFKFEINRLDIVDLTRIKNLDFSIFVCIVWDSGFKYIELFRFILFEPRTSKH